MPRGKAEFTTMKPITTSADGPHPQKNKEPQINECAPKLPGDPMRNILEGDGLVDHISKKGLRQEIINEASASIRK